MWAQTTLKQALKCMNMELEHVWEPSDATCHGSRLTESHFTCLSSSTTLPRRAEVLERRERKCWSPEVKIQLPGPCLAFSPQHLHCPCVVGILSKSYHNPAPLETCIIPRQAPLSDAGHRQRSCDKMWAKQSHLGGGDTQLLPFSCVVVPISCCNN